LLEIYYRFLKDATSKLVRGTAFQNIGPFIAGFKDQGVEGGVDGRIIEFFLATVAGTTSRDVCYYAAFNIPALFYVLGPGCWTKVKPVYLKLAKFNDIKISKTLASSIHEIAKIVGKQVSEEDLSPLVESFLNDASLHKEVKTAALKNLNVFLQQLSRHKRESFLKYILVQDIPSDNNSNSSLDWRLKLLTAQNIGSYAILYDEETLFTFFLP
jgi:serine/threonine-protein phosphatase 4 regulatory subunit 1